jgi:hypothetical protein
VKQPWADVVHGWTCDSEALGPLVTGCQGTDVCHLRNVS